MNTPTQRRKFSADFKAKVALEAIREKHSLEEIARKFELHPVQVSNWKKEALSKMGLVFESKVDQKARDSERKMEQLYAQIGQLKVENDFLKKSL